MSSQNADTQNVPWPSLSSPLVRFPRIGATFLSPSVPSAVENLGDNVEVKELVLTSEHLILSSGPPNSAVASKLGRVALFTLGPVASVAASTISSIGADSLSKMRGTFNTIDDKTMQNRYDENRLVWAALTKLTFCSYQCKTAIFYPDEYILVAKGEFNSPKGFFACKVVLTANSGTGKDELSALEKAGVSFSKEKMKSVIAFWERETGVRLP